MKRNRKNDRIKICYAFMSKCRDYNPLTKTFKTNMLMELPNKVPFELKYVCAIDLYFSDQGATKAYIAKELVKLGYDDCYTKAEEHIESCISGGTEFVGNELAVEVSFCDSEKELIEEIAVLVAEIEYICLKFKQKYMENDELKNNYDDDEDWWEKELAEEDWWEKELVEEDEWWEKELIDDDSWEKEQADDVDSNEEYENDDKGNKNIFNEEKQKNKGFSLLGLINKFKGDGKLKRDDKDDIVDDVINEGDNNGEVVSSERLDYIKKLNDVFKQKISQAEGEKTEAPNQNLCAVIVERFEMSPRLTAFAIGQYTKTPKEEVEEKLKNLPVVVANNMTADKAKQLVSNLSMMKISAKIEY